MRHIAAFRYFSPLHGAAGGFAALCACAALAQVGGTAQAVTPDGAAAGVLGPLILSPSQRRNLEAVRNSSSADGSVVLPLATDRALDASSVPEALVISGVVIRSGNRSTVWVNNQPLYGRTTNNAMRTLAGQAGVLHPGNKEMMPKAKPGQVIDVPSGQAVDLLPPGSIRIIPSKAGTGAAAKKE